MTPKQESLYWRLWSQACQAQAWCTSLGLTSNDINELRHQQHTEALGLDKSHKDFTNRDFDRVKARFELLINPDNLAASIALDHPEHGERKRLIYKITRMAPEPYRRKIMENKFHTTDLDHLDLNELTQLRNTLAARATNFRRDAASPSPGGEGWGEGEPAIHTLISDNRPF